MEELETLISKTVRNTLEDLQTISSDDYLHSIDKARNDYEEGRVKKLEEV